MVDVIIAFDSEDLLTPEAADAEMWWAEALRERGLRGSFQLVAGMVRALKRMGRNDVIKAIAAHEIGYHSDQHSVPPSHPVVVDGMPLGEAVDYVIGSEAAGLADIASTFSTWPVSYCPPGDSWTPASLLAMARMGMKIFCNDKLAHPTRRPYWYCGMLVGNYDVDFMEFYDKPQLQPGDFAQRFEALRAATPDDGIIILYTHPTRLVTANFWDVPFYAGATPRLQDCPPAPLRPHHEIERNKERCRGFLDWLKAQSGIRFIDFATLYEERSRNRRGLDELLAEQGLRPGQEGLLPLRHSPEGSFLPSSSMAGKRYEWPLYPPGFTGSRLVEQAAALTWTAAPSVRTAAGAARA